MFKGSFVALITPFKNGEVDKAAFKDFVEWQIGEGTHGLVPVNRRRSAMTSTTKSLNCASTSRTAGCR